MRKIPSGQTVRVAKLREYLAEKHEVDVVCPLTTGIFLRIVSEAVLDELASGKKIEEITPFWRVVSPKDKLAKKIRCGPDFHQARRHAEGIG